VNKLFFALLITISCSCLAQSNVQSLPSWKTYYDSTQIFWDKDWPKAISLLTRAEQFARIDLGVYDENYLTILSDLGLASWRVKDYARAEKYFQTTIAFKKEASATNTQEFYGLTNNLAGLYAEQEQWLKAKSLYKSVLDRSSSVVDIGIYNTALKNLLALYEAEGYPDSVLFLLQSNPIKQYTGEQRETLLPLELNLAQGKAYRKMKKYDEANNILNALLTKLAGQEQALLYERTLQESGLVFLEIGLYSKAEKSFLQAYRSLKSHPLPENTLLTTLLNNLAYVYDKLSIYDKALAYYEESLSICQLSHSINSLPCAALQSNIAGIYLKQNNLPEAISSYEALVKNFKGIMEESNLLYITALNNLATAYRNNNEYEKASGKLNEAYNLVKKYKLEEDDIAATVLNNLAVLSTGIGALTQAAAYAEKAYAIKKSIYGDQSILLLDLVSNMAIVYWALQDAGHAIPLLEKSMQLSIRQVRYVFPTLNENEQVQFYKKLKDDFERFNTVACQLSDTHPGLITDMFNNQIMIKSLVFFTQQRRSNLITEKKDSVLSIEYETLKAKREQLGYFYQLSLKELKRNGISLKELELEVDRLEKDITLKTSEDLTESGLAVNVEWNDIRERLQPDEALVELIRFRKYDLRRQEISSQTKTNFGFTDSIYYAALVTTKETTAHPVLILMKEGNDMETRFFSYYKNALTFEVPDQNSYSYYWKPFENALNGKTKIFLSGDGVYHKLNLNTLRQQDKGPYLLQLYEIHELLNPAQLLEQKRTSHNETAVLIGDPVFDIDLHSTARSEEDRSKKFNALPGTYAEITAIDEILKSRNWKTAMFLKASATERNLKRIHSPGLLHIATHGFFSTEFVSLNEEAKKDFLFHSGLILSGANKHLSEETQPFHDDGIVTAYEVMNLDLANTDLVVLSACETGLGKIENGEGVYGLQRSFLQAGARSVLISLWKVDDDPTKELMIKFYSYLSKGISKTESLKLAQLDQMKRFNNPMQWGGFVLVGAD